MSSTQLSAAAVERYVVAPRPLDNLVVKRLLGRFSAMTFSSIARSKFRKLFL